MPSKAEEISGVRELNNIVIFVRFNGETEAGVFGESLRETYDEMYNNSDISVNSYFNEISCGGVDITTHFTPVSIELEQERGYYKPKTLGNSIGYNDAKTGGKPHIEVFYREQMMIKEAVEQAEIESNIDLDYDNDGNVDLITFIISGEKGSWGDLLWPHMSSAWDFSKGTPSNYYTPFNYFNSQRPMPKGDIVLNDKKVNEYDFLLDRYLFENDRKIEKDGITLGSVGIICHELMHSLGAPDYYHYNSDSTNPAGKYDLMDITNNIPQYPLTYNRAKINLIGGESVEPVYEGGMKTLYPVSSDKTVKALKIVLPSYPDEYFMIEMRGGSNAFDKSCGNGETGGLIVYRIDEKAGTKNTSGFYETGGNYGNMNGPPDEVYVFRKNDRKDIYAGAFASYPLIDNKNINYFGKTETNSFPSGNTIYFQGTSNSAMKNKNSGIVINNLTFNEDGSCSFGLIIPQDNTEQKMAASYPKISAKTLTSFTMQIKAANRGKGYIYVLKKGGAAPLKEHLTEGSYPDAGNIVYYESYDITYAGAVKEFSLSGLSDKEYVVYILFSDSDGELTQIYPANVKLADNSTNNLTCLSFGIDKLMIAVIIVCLVIIVVILIKKTEVKS